MISFGCVFLDVNNTLNPFDLVTLFYFLPFFPISFPTFFLLLGIVLLTLFPYGPFSFVAIYIRLDVPRNSMFHTHN